MMKIFNNKVIIFVISRYFSYFIQFLNSLVAAYVLGPYYLGVWGFIALILQYLNFGNFGIDIALNVSLSTGDLSDSRKQSEIASNAMSATFLTSFIFMLLAIILYLADVPFFEKYLFQRYLFVVMVISCLNYFNVLFVNIFRTYSLFTPISIFQTIIQLLQLPMFFIFKDTQLIWSLLLMMVLAHLVSLVLFIRKLPFKLTFKADTVSIKSLYKRGLSLLSYAVTFYILLLSTRSLVGYFYPVETMGFFTFACNIAAALIVGLSSLEFVLFPKMLNRLSSDVITEKSINVFEEVRYIYRVTAFLVTIIGLLCYPVLLTYFKDYEGSENAFLYLVICQVIISSGFGYSTLIISKGKELFLVVHGLIALLINLVLSVGGRLLFDLDYSYMSLFLISSFVYYDVQVIRKGRELLRMKTTFYTGFKDLVPLRSLVPLILLLCSGFSGQYMLFNLLALVTFVAFNYRGYYLIKKYIQTLFNEPSVVNINR
jgi:O-antigen/teichoic acid export membrane protein